MQNRRTRQLFPSDGRSHGIGTHKICGGGGGGGVYQFNSLSNSIEEGSGKKEK